MTKKTSGDSPIITVDAPITDTERLDMVVDNNAPALTYEQEIHAALCTAIVHGEDLLLYFRADRKNVSGDDRRILELAITGVQENVERAKRLRDRALIIRDAAMLASKEGESDG